MFSEYVPCHCFIPQELNVFLQNNFIMVLSVSMEVDTLWWLTTHVMKAFHCLDHLPEFVSPLESGLERSHFVNVRKRACSSNVNRTIINNVP